MHAMMLFSCHAFHRRFLAGQATHFDCVHMAAFSPRRALRLAMLIAMTLVVLGQGTVSDSPAPPASFLNLLFYRQFHARLIVLNFNVFYPFVRHRRSAMHSRIVSDLLKRDSVSPKL